MNATDSNHFLRLAMMRGGKVQGNIPPAIKPQRKAKGTGEWSIAKARMLAAVVMVSGGREVTIPIRTVTESNTGGAGWQGKAARAKRQRWIARLMVGRLDLPAMPVTVRITRIGKRRMDDDNVASAAKHVRDGIADAFGVDDGSPLYRWEYGQEVGDCYGVRIKLEPFTF